LQTTMQRLMPAVIFKPGIPEVQKQVIFIIE